MNYELFPFVEFEEVAGGLRTKIVPNKHEQDIQIPQDALDEESHCLLTHEFDIAHWELEEDRRHFRLLNQGTVDYFPSFYCQPKFNHKITQYAWNMHITHHKPDPKYLQHINQILYIHLKEMYYHLSEGIYSELDTFHLSKCLFHFSWLNPFPKRSLCIYIAHLLRKQHQLKNILLENGHLRHEDGVRLLLTFSFTVGSSVETLYLWQFFVAGVMPLDIGYAEDMNDPFILTSDLKKHVPEEEKKRIWNECLMDDIYDLPHDYYYFFTIFLKSFTNLTALYLNYCWVALAQGVTLNLLSSIRNGKLRDLYLLCTREDMPFNSGCRVSPRAWLKAKQKCSNIRVHLVVMSAGTSYDDNLTLLQEEMPLTSYLLNAGLPILNYSKVRECWFDCLIRTLIYKYSQTLRKVYLEVWHPRSRVDMMITACLTQLPLLEQFTYCGSFDKIDTIKEICTYLLNYSTKLKLLKLLVLEDPCSPQKYKEVVKDIKKEFKYQLYDRGINFYLGTHII